MEPESDKLLMSVSGIDSSQSLAGFELDTSMDWFKGKSAGNHSFYHQIWGFPVKFPLNQSIEYSI
jgi:hypothetical protein